MRNNLIKTLAIVNSLEDKLSKHLKSPLTYAPLSYMCLSAVCEFRQVPPQGIGKYCCRSLTYRCKFYCSLQLYVKIKRNSQIANYVRKLF